LTIKQGHWGYPIVVLGTVREMRRTWMIDSSLVPEPIPSNLMRWTTPYSVRRVGRLDTCSDATKWAGIIDRELYGLSLVRLICWFIPKLRGDDRLSDILGSPVSFAIHAYSFAYPEALTLQMGRAILSSECARWHAGALTLISLFPSSPAFVLLRETSEDRRHPYCQSASRLLGLVPEQREFYAKVKRCPIGDQ